MNKNYSDTSVKLTKTIDKDDKKNNGIYFTHPETIEKNIEFLDAYIKDIKTVLEPSCGSGEFINQIKKYPHLDITGIEINKTIFKSIKSMRAKNIKLYNQDYLKYKSDKLYDLIIGNPPYFVMKKSDVDKQYYEYFDGRPNIFILFIIKSLGLLSEKGILSFILPRNFLNCLYYEKTRQYINKNYQILTILECKDNYLDTQQETVILILQKSSTPNNKPYCLDVNNSIIFGTKDQIEKIHSLYENSTSLLNLGFDVAVGNIVWNQNKKTLSDDNTNTLLIYSSDIKNNILKIQKYSNPEKKNYICRKGHTQPLLVINRGYGKGKYIFNYCIINETDTVEYLVENHLICIRYTKDISNDELITMYKKIINSFENKKTRQFIELYFGNNAINTMELQCILPIYDI